MLKTTQSNRFKREMRRLRKQGRDISKMETAVRMLASRMPLPVKHKDHKLTGNWIGYRECHLAPDWLLIYRIRGDELQLVRTGSHTELFGM